MLAGENPLESFNLPPDGEILSKASATRGATCQDEAKAPRSPFSKPREGGGSSSSLAVQFGHTVGWDVSWEITNWGNLIEEVVKNQDAPLEDLSEVPREEGAKGTNLYFWTTGLDAWGNTGAKTRRTDVITLQQTY